MPDLKRLEELPPSPVAGVSIATWPDGSGVHSVLERVVLQNGRRFYRDEDGTLAETDPVPGTEAWAALTKKAD